ncbi:hypothetical protein [Sporisorium scitamineum]|uniref:Uncharacterized protein n=1 Tax=Sporisorium scitamineum TaxID=49012 RepID=A0A0F7RVK9_9BASI|nr:hypothetical protein [Sporisorium scitamineum]
MANVFTRYPLLDAFMIHIGADRVYHVSHRCCSLGGFGSKDDLDFPNDDFVLVGL